MVAQEIHYSEATEANYSLTQSGSQDWEINILTIWLYLWVSSFHLLSASVFWLSLCGAISGATGSSMDYERWLAACNNERRLLGEEPYIDNDETFNHFIDFKMKNIFGKENWNERIQGLIGKSEEKKDNLTKQEILELICHLQGWDTKSDMAVSLNRSNKGVLLEWLNTCLGKS